MTTVGASLMNAPIADRGRDALDVAAAPDAAEKHRRYAAMVRRFRELVARTVPPTARVAVVSKGDDELLRLGQRVASHFPRDPGGGYAGYHPRSGAEALSMLRASRADGIEYLLVPATSLWWRDTYVEFGEYLSARCRRVADEDGTGAVYELRRTVAAEPADAPRDEEAAQLEDLVRAVLPGDARIAVLADAAGARCTFDRWSPAGLSDPRGPGDDSLVALEELSWLRGSADYLVVPAATDPPSPFRAALRAALESARPVLDHRHVCAVFDLRDGQGSRKPVEHTTAQELASEIADVCRLILPRAAVVVLAGSDDETRARVDHVGLVRLVIDPNVDVDAFLALLDTWCARGVDYVVVTPRTLIAVDSSGGARSRLDARYACRWADRRCLVYDVRTLRRRAHRSISGRSAG